MENPKLMEADDLAEALYYARAAAKLADAEEKEFRSELISRLNAGHVTRGRFCAQAVTTHVSRVDWKAAFIDMIGQAEADNLEAAARENPKPVIRLDVRDIGANYQKPLTMIKAAG